MQQYLVVIQLINWVVRWALDVSHYLSPMYASSVTSTNCLIVGMFVQQGVSARISSRISAIEGTQSEFREQMSEVLHTSQQNTLVLNNLKSMFSIIMEKIGNPVSVLEPKSPTTKTVTSQGPSVDRMFVSVACSGGEPPLPKENLSKDANDVAQLKGKSVLQVVGSPECEVTEDGIVDLGGNVVADIGESSLKASGKGEAEGNSGGEGRKSDGKIEALADSPKPATDSGEVNSKGSGSGEDKRPSSEPHDPAPPLSPEKRVRPKTRTKNKQKSSTIVGTSGSQKAHPCEQVSPGIGMIGNISATKLLIFNIHGTLLDCSLLSKPNPNPTIRITRKSLTRRIVFRPWLTEFLDRCFKNFRVGFWGMKSLSNMEDVVTEMMRKVEGLESHQPLFCWSARDCEEHSENSGVGRWKKPLSKVWSTWPIWNESNTMIIDHIGAVVNCNPVANIIIPSAFEVENMKKLADERNYLRHLLWPLLESLAGSPNVQEFRSVLPATPGVADVTNTHAAGRATRSSRKNHPQSDLKLHAKLSGEGTCELRVHILECPLT